MVPNLSQVDCQKIKFKLVAIELPDECSHVNRSTKTEKQLCFWARVRIGELESHLIVKFLNCRPRSWASRIKTPSFYAHSYNFEQWILSHYLSTHSHEEIFSPSKLLLTVIHFRLSVKLNSSYAWRKQINWLTKDGEYYRMSEQLVVDGSQFWKWFMLFLIEWKFIVIPEWLKSKRQTNKQGNKRPESEDFKTVVPGEEGQFESLIDGTSSSELYS